MSSAFAITTSVSEVDAVPGTPLPLQVTVTNKTGQPLQALARVVTAPPERAGWATVDPPGAALAPEQTQVFGIHLTVPPGTPGGSFTVRLDVIDRDNPDEVGTTGQVVTVRIPGSAPVSTGRTPVGYLAAAAGSLLGAVAGGAVGFGLGLLLFEDTVEESGESVTDVIGGAIGGLFLLFLAMVFLAYVGSCVGCGLGLKARRYARPWVTAAVQVFVLPVWGVLTAIAGSLVDASGSAGGTVLMVLVFCVPPVLCRAVTRPRSRAS